jgi:hypothetical protein
MELDPFIDMIDSFTFLCFVSSSLGGISHYLYNEWMEWILHNGMVMVMVMNGVDVKAKEPHKSQQDTQGSQERYQEAKESQIHIITWCKLHTISSISLPIYHSVRWGRRRYLLSMVVVAIHLLNIIN